MVIGTTLARCVQVLKEVAELAKYYCRSMNIGYKRLTQQFLAAQGTAKDSSDEYGQAVNSLRAVWGPQRIRVLETVSVCCHYYPHDLVVSHLEGTTDELRFGSGAWHCAPSLLSRYC